MSYIFLEFEMKDFDPSSYFLGIEIASSSKSYLPSKYVNELIHRAQLMDDKLVDMPIELYEKFSASNGVPLDDPTLYCELVGRLFYFTITLPDVAYAIHVVNFYASYYSLGYFVAHFVLCMRYKIFQAYANADWVGNINDRKSTTSFYVFLGASILTWKSKRQSVLACFTVETKYRVMAQDTAKIVWLHYLLSILGIIISLPTPFHCDNKSTIQIAHNSMFHERTKNIEIDCHFVRQHLQLGTIDLPFVSSTT